MNKVKQGIGKKWRRPPKEFDGADDDIIWEEEA